MKSFRIVRIVCLIRSILLATNDILHYFSGSVNTFFYFFEDTGNRTLAEGGMLMKTRRWLKVECSPSDTPPILLPRHLPPSLSFAANSLRSHMPLCDSMAGTGLPADVRRCSEWICFPPPASCFLQTQKPLPRPSFEGRDRVWRSTESCS